jgi:hypothetical protein
VKNLSLHTAGRNFWWKICPCTPQDEIFGEKFVPAHRRTKFWVENLSLHTAGRNFAWKICPCTPQGEIFGAKFVPAHRRAKFLAENLSLQNCKAKFLAENLSLQNCRGISALLKGAKRRRGDPPKPSIA